MGQVFLIKSSQLFTQSWILLLLMEPERFVSLYPEELAGRAGACIQKSWWAGQEGDGPWGRGWCSLTRKPQAALGKKGGALLHLIPCASGFESR